MKLVIFGSTGSVGKQVVRQALTAGHTVTAFTRSPDKLKEIHNSNFHFFEGDVFDPMAVQKAIAGQEVVLCTLGAGRKGKVRAEGTRNIIDAMKRTGVSRLICQSTLGAGDSAGNLNFFWKYIMFGWFLKDAFVDHELQEKYVKESNLDWTIVRPAAFQDGEVTGAYKHGFSSSERGLTLKISRPDVAHFMLEQINSEQYLRSTPGLSY